MIEWLLAPIDAARVHDVPFHQAWHGRLMVIAWGVLVPIGVLAARFFKVLPTQRFPEVVDNRAWWRTHLGAQWSSLAMMTLGLLMVLNAPTVQPSLTQASWLHAWLGYAVLALGLTQAASGLLRGSKGGPTDPRGRMRGDHYDMTARRRAFERLHKTLGYAALALSAAAVLSGLWQANAPRWFWLVLTVWWIAIAALFVAFQRRGMVMDTYVAIWGPDPTHPGHPSRRPRRDHRGAQR